MRNSIRKRHPSGNGIKAITIRRHPRPRPRLAREPPIRDENLIPRIRSRAAVLRAIRPWKGLIAQFRGAGDALGWDIGIRG